MSWTKSGGGRGGQLGTVHRYRTLARLSDHEYRTLLYRVTGCRSSADPHLTQDDFDRFMAELEMALWERYGQGLCDEPPAWVKPTYWQDRCPATGRANSRQLRLLRGLADRFWREREGGGSQDDCHVAVRMTAATLSRLEGWLLGACRKAGCPVDRLDELGDREAERLIEALKDRLRALGIDTREEGLTQGRTRRAVKGRADRTDRAGLNRKSGEDEG